MLNSLIVLGLLVTSFSFAEHSESERVRGRASEPVKQSISEDTFYQFMKDEFASGIVPNLKGLNSSDWVGSCVAKPNKVTPVMLHLFEKSEFDDVTNRFTRRSLHERMLSFSWGEATDEINIPSKEEIKRQRSDKRESIAKFGSSFGIDPDTATKDGAFALQGGAMTSGGAGNSTDYSIRTNSTGNQMFIRIVDKRFGNNGTNVKTTESYCVLWKQD